MMVAMKWRPIQRRAPYLGAFSLSLGVLFAVLAPTTGYELSIYRESPTLMWVSLGIAFSAAVVSVFSDRDLEHYSGVVLAVLTTATVAGIPILRAYYFAGARDALTHVGIAESYLAGSMAGESVIYPLTHVYAALVVRVTGVSIQTALMILVPLLVVVFVLSSYLVTRLLTGSRETAAIGLLTGCFLLPIVSIRLPVLAPIPNTLSVFYSLFVIYVSFRTALLRRGLGWLVALAGAVAGAVFLHPLLAGTVIVVFGAIAIVNTRIRLRDKLVLPAAVSLWGLLWITRFGTRLEYFVALWTAKISGIGGDVSTAGESLGRIGVSLAELAVRLAAVKLLFLALSIGLGVWLLYRAYTGRATMTEHRQLTLAIGTIPIGLAVVVFFGLGVSNQWSRYLGFLLAFTTVLGAIGLSRLVKERVSTPGHRTAVLVAAVLLMAMPAALVMHPSPYLVRPNQQVTETQSVAFGHAFDTQSTDVDVAGMALVPRNFRHAHYGSREASLGLGGIERNSEAVNDTAPPPNLGGSYREAYPHPTTLVVSERARRVHLELYQSEVQGVEDFEALEANPDIERTYDNGAERHYLFE